MSRDTDMSYTVSSTSARVDVTPQGMVWLSFFAGDRLTTRISMTPGDAEGMGAKLMEAAVIARDIQGSET